MNDSAIDSLLKIPMKSLSMTVSRPLVFNMEKNSCTKSCVVLDARARGLSGMEREEVLTATVNRRLGEDQRHVSGHRGREAKRN